MMKIQANTVGQIEYDPNERVFLDRVSLQDADYSRRELRHFGAFGSRLERCHFVDAQIDDCSFGEGQAVTEYIDCNFDGLRFHHSIGNVARFVRCSFRDVDLRNWSCFEAEFIDCVFTGRMRKCIFNGTVSEEDRSWVGRERNEFRGNDFSGMELNDVAFRTGIDLEQQRLPIGPDYLYVPDAPAAIERARIGLAEWNPGTGLQRRALILVKVYAEDVESGQRQLLIHLPSHCKGLAKTPHEVVDKVVELFKGANQRTA